MVYIPGKNLKAFITTEHPTAGVILTGSGALPCGSTSGLGAGATDSSKYGIAPLGSLTTHSDTTNRIRNIEGVDLKPSYEDDTFQPYGTDADHDVQLRKTFEITITKKQESPAYRVLFDGGRAGVLATNSLQPTDWDYADTFGYRIYLWDGVSWIVLYHATMPADGHSEGFDNNKIKTEVLKFKGNYWSGSVGASGLTASLVPY
jgi:hypothetical protein